MSQLLPLLLFREENHVPRNLQARARRPDPRQSVRIVEDVMQTENLSTISTPDPPFFFLNAVSGDGESLRRRTCRTDRDLLDIHGPDESTDWDLPSKAPSGLYALPCCVPSASLCLLLQLLPPDRSGNAALAISLASLLPLPLSVAAAAAAV